MKKSFFHFLKPYIWVLSFVIFTTLSFYFGFNPGKKISESFTHSFVEMISFIPFLFIIVGLFDVWFPKEKIEKYVGKGTGIKGIFIMIILAMLQAGPLYAAFPIAYILYQKGAGIRNVFIYLSAFSAFKIPMLGLEIGYLGWEFTMTRTLVSLPLCILIGFIMEWYLSDKNFKINNITS